MALNDAQQWLWDSFFSLEMETIEFTDSKQVKHVSTDVKGQYSASIINALKKLDAGTIYLYLQRAKEEKSPEKFQEYLNMLGDPELILALRLLNDFCFNHEIIFEDQDYGYLRRPKALTHFFGKIDPDFAQKQETIEFDKLLEDKFKGKATEIVDELIKVICKDKDVEKIKKQVKDRLIEEESLRFLIKFELAIDNNSQVEMLKLVWNASNLVLRTAKNKEGRTALMQAAAMGQTACVRAILQKVPEAAADGDENGSTALMYAAVNGEIECVRAILAKIQGAAYYRDEKGGTALMYATDNGQTTCVIEILKEAPDAAVYVDDQGHTALMHAIMFSKIGCVEAILKTVPQHTHCGDNNGMTALMYAARNGKTEYVREILKVQDAAQYMDHNNWTALRYAAVNGQIDCVKEILPKLSDDAYGHEDVRNALTIAESAGNQELIDILKSFHKGAKPG